MEEALQWHEHEMTLVRAMESIESNMRASVRNYVAVGFYLKAIRDRKLFEEAGYKNFEGFVKDKYDHDKGWASRCIKVNDKLSKGGNSPVLEEGYREYKVSQLIELSYLTDEQREQAKPEMTVKQLQGIRKPKVNSDSKKVVISQQQEKTGKCLHRPDFDCSLEDADKRNQGDGEDCTHSCCWECAKHGDCRLECYASAKRPVEDAAEKQQNPDERCEKSSGEDATEQLSAYGTPKKVYPADSLIATEACEDGHYCFSCAMECQIRGEERYCREAPMGNPFPCETMNILGGLREKVGNMCQFINHDLADIKVVGNEPNPCCKNCEDPCEYMCCRAKKDLPADPEEKTEEDTKEVIDGEFQEIATADRYTPQYFLQKEQKKLNDLLEAFKDTNPEDIPQKLFLHQKIIVAALAAMVCDLENEELKKQLEEEKPQQPELPQLKNNDQRAAFVDAYKTWPIWIETKETGERYYRYELPDAAMVVKVYFHKCFDYNAPASGRWEDRYHDDWGNPEYYLELDGKYFRDCLVNRSALIDYLKEMQKNKR
ncbi:MAG: hypothetical protein ACI4F3_09835 [Enterocloster sp.]